MLECQVGTRLHIVLSLPFSQCSTLQNHLTDSTHCESWALYGGLFISDVLGTGQPRSMAFGLSFSDLLVAAGLGPAPWGPDLGSPMWLHCLEASHMGQCSVLVNCNSLQLLNKATAPFSFHRASHFIENSEQS